MPAFAAENGTAAGCRATAADLAGKAGDALGGATITCAQSGDTVTATVSGSVLSLVPGWTPHVSQSATKTVERLT